MDITVRGAGIFGLSIAWACAVRGARVQVVDPFGPGSGSSGGLVGALAPHVPETWNDKKAFQLDSLLMAEDWWRSVAEAGGHDPGYARLGRVQPLVDDRAVELARSRTDGARSLWRGRAVWEVVSDVDVPGWFLVSPTGWVARDTLTARLHPRQACLALIAALKTLGVSVVTDAPDRGAVVHATGWQGLGALSTAMGKPVGAGVKGQSLALHYPYAANWPQVFVDGLHIVPHADGTVAIGSTSERDFDDPHSTDHACDDLLAKAIAALPELRDAPVMDLWAGVRPRARSRAPMLGAWPDRPGHYVANGGFKIGFGMAPKVAEVMADLLLDGRDVIPDAFRVEASL